MIDPSLPMHAAIVAALKASADVQALCGAAPGTRVYDAVPAGAVKPYITIGKPQVLPDKAACLDGAEVSFPVHGWAAGPQAVVIKQLGAAIIAALDEQYLTVTGHRLVVFEIEQVRYLDDPDPLTQHVAVVLRALTEPT